MDFTKAMEFVDSCNTRGMVLGLDAMYLLLERLGNPEKELKFIHIAGTNGKGSVGAYVTSILVCSGYKIGRYVSPTIFEYCERIQIQTKESCSYIAKKSVGAKMERIKQAVDSMVHEGHKAPTAFEIETALAFLEFKEQSCDYVVLEVGLGGVEDATNVVQNVELAILTSISRDHMRVLGNTIEEITQKKAGIIKRGIDVVGYDYREYTDGKKMEAVIHKVCKEKEAKYVQADFSKLTNLNFTLDGTDFCYDGMSCHIRLLGENQPKNAALALEAVKCLQRKGLLITQEAMEEGLQKTEWKGRFSVVSKKPFVIVDGAHNEDAAKSLAKTLELYFKGKKLIFIVGVFADKEYEKILEITSPFAKKVYTIASDNSRALPSDELARVARKYVEDVVDAKTVKDALDSLDLRQDETILAFGSLSFLGEIYTYFDNRKNKRN